MATIREAFVTEAIANATLSHRTQLVNLKFFVTPLGTLNELV